MTQPSYVSDRDIYIIANLLLLEHGEREAWRFAVTRALDLHMVDDLAGREVWERIIAAIKLLTRCELGEGERVQ